MTGTPDPMSRSHKVFRVEREETFGARLRGWILRSEARFVDVARHLGVTTNVLSDALDGSKHVRAAWLELLPPVVERLYLAERAEHHALQLVPKAAATATIADAIAQVGAVLTLCSTSEADGFVSVEEAETDLRALHALARKLQEVIAHRERAIRERGLSILVGGKR